MKNQQERIDTFTNRLNKAMEIRKLKQSDLVRRTNLSKQQISQYVNGKFEAKQKSLFILAQTLDVNESWLMGFDVDMEKNKSSSIDLHQTDNIKALKQTFVDYGILKKDEPLTDKMLEKMMKILATIKQNTNDF